MKIRIKRDMFRVKLSTLIFSFLLIFTALFYFITGPHDFHMAFNENMPIETNSEEEIIIEPIEESASKKADDPFAQHDIYGKEGNENAIDDTNGY